MFKNAKVDDRVWDVSRGWGIIQNIRDEEEYPIQVRFDNININSDAYTYTYDGKFYSQYSNPSLFWDEVKFEIPKKPITLKEVEIPICVLVKLDGAIAISTKYTGIHTLMYEGKIVLNIPEDIDINTNKITFEEVL